MASKKDVALMKRLEKGLIEAGYKKNKHSSVFWCVSSELLHLGGIHPGVTKKSNVSLY